MKSYFLIFIFISFLSCNNKTQFSIDENYISKFEESKIKRTENRINYLQLTGLFKLNAETNTFGKDSINDFVLNIEELAPTIGTISVFEDSLVFSASENVIVKNNQDSIITNYHLELNEYGSSIKLYHKQLYWQVITRSKQYYLRVWDTKNPTIEAFNGFEQYKLNPEFIFEGICFRI